ncbi:putative phosphoprotein phosphatase [Blattamonas nauphoetae]|uniref:Phosphoprotein phosphatase n=1 Tax=Blattamonas nauphoetae TaxID=2049346 RepID=A0ABQ9YKG0_9EUKA|nr:putative phosphoprotein phosphatase [Blattamonas nauphoetae]
MSLTFFLLSSGYCVFTKPMKFTIFHTNDMHGWYDSHPRESNLDGTFPDYENMVNYKKSRKNEDEVVFAFDSGDHTQGTGLSDATDPPGTLPFKLLKLSSIDATTPGNHELYDTTSVVFMKDYVSRELKDRYLCGNTFFKDGDKIVEFGTKYRIIPVPNIGNMLVLGMLYTFEGGSERSYVQPVQEVLEETWLKEVLQTDDIQLVILLIHNSPQHKETTLFRDLIRSNLHDVPLIILGGHSHELINDLETDNELHIESGGFFRYFSMIEFTLTDSAKHNRGAGLNMDNVQVSQLPTSLSSFKKAVGFQEQGTSEWESPQAKEMRILIKDVQKTFKLTEEIGCSPNEFPNQPSHKNSLYRLVVDQIYPKMKSFQPTKGPDTANKRNYIYLINNASQRSSLYKGSITQNDLYSIEPFQNFLCAIRNVSGADWKELQTRKIMKCDFWFDGLSMDHQNDQDLTHLSQSNEEPVEFIPRYLFTNISTRDEDRIDLISTTYDCSRISKVFESFLPGKYKIEHSTIKTRDVYFDYITKYLKCRRNPVKSSVIFSIIAAVGGVALAALLIVVFVCCCRKKKKDYTYVPIND